VGYHRLYEIQHSEMTRPAGRPGTGPACGTALDVGSTGIIIRPAARVGGLSEPGEVVSIGDRMAVSTIAA
jgi:hypothetical protein